MYKGLEIQTLYMEQKREEALKQMDKIQSAEMRFLRTDKVQDMIK
jgi:hypothetical protein